MKPLTRILSKPGLIIATLIGLVLGIGLFTFVYAEGFSYFSTDPTACVNCHVMREEYDSWQKSSHHAVAKCVDCHLPHEGLEKWVAKAENGFWHSKGFTLMDFHDPIMIKPKNSRILQDNCMSCHQDMVHGMVAGATTDADAVNCVHCHMSVGHGPTR